MTSLVATVYLVTNQVTGDNYVGVTRMTPEERWLAHQSKSRGAKPRSWFHRAIKKYGPDKFSVVAVASCLSQDAAQATERSVIRTLRPTYNQTNGGEFTVGRSITPATRAKLAKSATGRQFTPAQNAANSVRAKARYESSPAWKETVLAALSRGRLTVNKEKRGLAAGKSARERVWSDASRAKLSASCMGRRYGRDVLDRMAASKGKAVVCTTTGEVFASMLEASAKMGIDNCGIGRVCRGTRLSAGGHKFSYR